MSFADLDNDSYQRRYQGSYNAPGQGGRAPAAAASATAAAGGGYGSTGYGGYGNDDIYSGLQPSGGQGRAAAPSNANARFDDLVSRVIKDISELSKRLKAIQALASKLGGKQDSHDLRHKMNDGIKEAQQMAKNTNQSLKMLGKIARESNNANYKKAHEKLVKDFQEWGRRFQDIAKTSTVKERETSAPARGPMSGDIAAGPMSSYNQEDEISAELQEADRQYAQVQSELDFNEALIADREGEIQQIESSMAELNEIFRDLNSVVHDQQTMVDNIATNIDVAHVDVEEGVKELQSAAKTQKKSRWRMCLILTIVAIVLVVVVVGVMAGLNFF